LNGKHPARDDVLIRHCFLLNIDQIPSANSLSVYQVGIIIISYAVPT
jgi:hypothetical protein